MYLAMANKRPSLSFIPPLLPDQTLYSWVTLFHELSGNVSERETLIQLFGSEKAGRHFHIPSHLDAFCASTQLTLGATEAIISSATVLPAYLRFRPNSVVHEVLQHVCGSQTAGIAQTLRIARTRMHAFPPRRLCHLCVEQDLQTHGMAYWHRAHQLPGAFLCIHHGASLLITPMFSQDKRRGNLFTPNQDVLSTALRGSACQYAERQLPTLNRLSRLADRIAATPLPGGYSRSNMGQACISALAERNLWCADTTDCALRAAKDYARHFSSVAQIPDLASILSERSTRLLWGLLSKTQDHDHPLEYVLLIDWLFGDWETFLSHYSQQGSP